MLASGKYRPRVCIQRGASGIVPLFCVPGAGASATSFVSLATALGNELPVHGFEPRGLHGNFDPYPDVKAAAHDYVQAMLELSSSGPFDLVGHSHGGLIAFEMARILSAVGGHVTSLVVVDAEPPQMPEAGWPVYSPLDCLCELLKVMQMSMQRPIGVSRADLEQLSSDRQLDVLLERCREAGFPFAAHASLRSLAAMAKVFSAGLTARYQSDYVFDGTLHLVLAAERGDDPDANRKHEEGWADNARRLDVFVAPGNHMTMLGEPHIDVLAKWLRAEGVGRKA